MKTLPRAFSAEELAKKSTGLIRAELVGLYMCGPAKDLAPSAWIFITRRGIRQAEEAYQQKIDALSAELKRRGLPADFPTLLRNISEP